MTPTVPKRTPPPQPRWPIRVAAIAALAAVIGVGIWLGVRQTGSTTPGSSTASTSQTHQAIAVSAAGLKTISGALDQPIYWAGPRSGMTYELTQTTGRTYLRYLPAGAPIGSPRPYLTVGTYMFTGAYDATLNVASKAGSVRVDAGPGKVAFYSKSKPTNVYLSYQNSNYQIEVYSPVAGQALSLVKHQSVVPVDGVTPVTVSSTQPDLIEPTARTLGHAVFWIGPKAGTTYELSTTASGRSYLRYLPAGTSSASTTPYLTVGTYPMPSAYNVTLAAASQPNSVRISVAHGVGFYSTAHPTSVYVAFPNVPVQIEVFDPSAATARALVAAGRVRQLPS